MRNVETDILGAPYQRRTILLPPDEEGDVVATLVSLKAPSPSRRAVLYLHGFIDYFFQTHLAEFFTGRGFDFYALDLRKYGRSLLAHQTPNYCRDIGEYDAEIEAALKIIREEDGHDTVLLNGHSTGGLIGALYAHAVRGSGRLQGLVLNSPFFEFNEPPAKRTLLPPIIRLLARVSPKTVIAPGVETVYGTTIHADYQGEWSYDLAWKQLNGFKAYAGWVSAISRAQRRLQRGLAIDVPVLLASSTRSYVGKQVTPAAHNADAVLNVADMARYGPGLGSSVTMVQIENGKHDLALSAPAARAAYFDELSAWLDATPGLGAHRSPGDRPAPAAEPSSA